MKKKKLSLQRESITQLGDGALRGINGGIQTDSNTCTGGQTNGCPSGACTLASACCTTSVSSVVRLGQHYGC